MRPWHAFNPSLNAGEIIVTLPDSFPRKPSLIPTSSFIKWEENTDEKIGVIRFIPESDEVINGGFVKRRSTALSKYANAHTKVK